MVELVRILVDWSEHEMRETLCELNSSAADGMLAFCDAVLQGFFGEAPNIRHARSCVCVNFLCCCDEVRITNVTIKPVGDYFENVAQSSRFLFLSLLPRLLGTHSCF